MDRAAIGFSTFWKQTLQILVARGAGRGEKGASPKPVVFIVSRGRTRKTLKSQNKSPKMLSVCKQSVESLMSHPPKVEKLAMLQQYGIYNVLNLE